MSFQYSMKFSQVDGEVVGVRASLLDSFSLVDDEAGFYLAGMWDL